MLWRDSGENVKGAREKAEMTVKTEKKKKNSTMKNVMHIQCTLNYITLGTSSQLLNI